MAHYFITQKNESYFKKRYVVIIISYLSKIYNLWDLQILGW